MNVVVIGAGALGKRHLQSIMNLEIEKEVYVLDVSKDALDEVSENYKTEVKCVSEYSELPQIIDYCVISSSSAVRRQIFEQLVDASEVRNIIFEKVLFQKPEDFEFVGNVLKSKKINAWVNCARREWPSYIDFKKYLSRERILSFNMIGGDWGLGCNLIHSLDLIEYLTNSAIRNLSLEYLDSKIKDSKRVGYKEITGTVTGNTDNCDFFQISSLLDSNSPSIIYITTEKKLIIINEGVSIKVIDSCSMQMVEENGFPIVYQSKLTEKSINEIIETGDCYLAKFEDSAKLHLKMLEPLAMYFDQFGFGGKICPIT